MFVSFRFVFVWFVWFVSCLFVVCVFVWLICLYVVVLLAPVCFELVSVCGWFGWCGFGVRVCLCLCV